MVFIRFKVFWTPKALYFLRFFIVFHVLDQKSGYKIAQTFIFVWFEQFYNHFLDLEHEKL